MGEEVVATEQPRSPATSSDAEMVIDTSDRKSAFQQLREAKDCGTKPPAEHVPQQPAVTEGLLTSPPSSFYQMHDQSLQLLQQQQLAMHMAMMMQAQQQMQAPAPFLGGQPEQQFAPQQQQFHTAGPSSTAQQQKQQLMHPQFPTILPPEAFQHGSQFFPALQHLSQQQQQPPPMLTMQPPPFPTIAPTSQPQQSDTTLASPTAAFGAPPPFPLISPMLLMASQALLTMSNDPHQSTPSSEMEAKSSKEVGSANKPRYPQPRDALEDDDEDDEDDEEAADALGSHSDYRGPSRTTSHKEPRHKAPRIPPSVAPAARGVIRTVQSEPQYSEGRAALQSAPSKMTLPQLISVAGSKFLDPSPRSSSPSERASRDDNMANRTTYSVPGPLMNRANPTVPCPTCGKIFPCQSKVCVKRCDSMLAQSLFSTLPLRCYINC